MKNKKKSKPGWATVLGDKNPERTKARKDKKRAGRTALKASTKKVG